VCRRASQFERYNVEALRIFGLQAVRCEHCAEAFMPDGLDAFLAHVQHCSAARAADARRQRAAREAAARAAKEAEAEAARQACADAHFERGRAVGWSEAQNRCGIAAL
jgi:hypothetical protein